MDDGWRLTFNTDPKHKEDHSGTVIEAKRY